MKNKEKTIIGTSILASLAASICCITPVLAIVAGTGSFASSFSWLEPLRPYLIGLTVLVLAYAWYDKLLPKKEIECACEDEEKPSFWKSKKFLVIITIFAAVATAFPYYSSVFYPKQEKQIMYVNPDNIKTSTLDIEGMTCTACNFTVQHAANEVQGVLETKADYHTGKAVIKYDASKTNINDVIKSINKTTYNVKSQE